MAAESIAVQGEKTRDSRDLLLESQSNELVIAIVGHIGSGTSEIAEAVGEMMSAANFDFSAEIIKASQIIANDAEATGTKISKSPADIARVDALQNHGDLLRKLHGHSIVAAKMVKEINATRRKLQKTPEGQRCVPDGKKRAYILDSIRHPAEVQLLRTLYKRSFVLVGVVCDPKIREQRLLEKFKDDATRNQVLELMERDNKTKEEFGQQVAGAFYLSDIFVDNSLDRFLDKSKHLENKAWTIIEEIKRVVTVITRHDIVRPRAHEIAMAAAHAAALRSACLSRQVGAAIERDGTILSTGSNDVPAFDGGLYTTGREGPDERCAFQDGSHCKNTTEQDTIARETVDSLQKIIADTLAAEWPKLAVTLGYKKSEPTKDEPRTPLNQILEELKPKLVADMRGGRLGSLIEFSRAVHAEMDALIGASKRGTSLHKSTMYVTTFPCHFCARHIVAAGIHRVVFIEPYPKSMALTLHSDSIELGSSPSGQNPPSRKVLFSPYVGIAPRMFSLVFEKDRELKNKKSGVKEIGPAEWGESWRSLKMSHVELEERLLKESK